MADSKNWKDRKISKFIWLLWSLEKGENLQQLKHQSHVKKLNDKIFGMTVSQLYYMFRQDLFLSPFPFDWEIAFDAVQNLFMYLGPFKKKFEARTNKQGISV